MAMHRAKSSTVALILSLVLQGSHAEILSIGATKGGLSDVTRRDSNEPD